MKTLLEGKDTIPVGIGDIFIYKSLCDTWDIEDVIKINLTIIDDYRYKDEKNYKFVRDLLDILFKNREINWVREPINVTHYINHFELKSTSLVKYFDVSPVYNFEYVVFHTKCRFDGVQQRFLKQEKPIFVEAFKNLKFSCPVLLLGEKEVDNVFETKYHKIESIYQELLALKENNEVIDLTRNFLIKDQNIKNLTEDIRIIHNAKFNFGFGFGGNFVISGAVGKLVWFIGGLNHKYISDIQKNKIANLDFYRDPQQYVSVLKSL